MMTVTIYGLRTSGDNALRYVGQTKRALEARLSSHLKSAGTRDCRLERWIKKSVASGHRIEIFEIERDAILHEAEKKWIAFYRDAGANLVNVTDGGEGNHGYKWTPQQLANISAKRKGRIITPEWRANISAATKGKPKMADFGAKVSAGKKGKKFSQEHCDNISKARKGKPLTEEHKAKLKAAKVGFVMSDEHRRKVTDSINARRHLYHDLVVAANRRPEVRASKSEKMKAWWAHRGDTPVSAETRLRMSAAQKKRYEAQQHA